MKLLNDRPDPTSHPGSQIQFLAGSPGKFALNSLTLLPSPRIIIVMGVAGSGKTTVGRMVAAALNWAYYEADDFHPPANIAKMSAGQPLRDSDRAPWLDHIRAKIDECRAVRENAVFTCSALKERYRAQLGASESDVLLVHLTGDATTLLARLGQRQGHYMKPDMLQSQLDTLEAPTDALTVDVKLAPEEIVQQIVQRVSRS